MGNHDHRLAGGNELQEELEDVLGRGRIEVARRLVGHQQRRVVGQSAGDGRALLLTAGDLAGQLVSLVGQPDGIEQGHRPRLPFTPRQLLDQVHRQHDVLDQAERRQQLKELEDDAQMFATPDGQLVFGHRMHRLAGDDDLPLAGVVDAGDHVEQRRFAVARRADDGHELAGHDVERDAFEDGHVAVADVEAFDDVLDLDDGR